jgi:hypothetical protein
MIVPTTDEARTKWLHENERQRVMLMGAIIELAREVVQAVRDGQHLLKDSNWPPK